MTIMPPVVPLDDTATLEALDWDIACGYHPEHESVGSGPATLAVWYLDPSPCGCSSPKFRHFCDGCWGYRNQFGAVHCPECGADYPCMTGILRVERI